MIGKSPTFGIISAVGVAALRMVGTMRVAKPRAPRRPTYAEELLACLALCWRVACYPTGKRLRRSLPSSSRRGAETASSSSADNDAELLCRMSPGAIDRRLAPMRHLLGAAQAQPHQARRALESQIPIRNWSEWNDARPGCFRLVRDRAVDGEAAAIAHASAQFPFPILGLDSDNRSELINVHLFDYYVWVSDEKR